MVRKFLFATILFLWPFLPIQAQGPIYLPFISGESGDCMFAILEITDGSTAVSLISPGVGLHLKNWDPSVIQPKGGGTFQSSSLAPFRRPVNFVDSDGNEVFDLKINGHGQDALIRDLQNFFRLLLKGRNYWPSKTQDVPVYIRGRASCETNTWYAHLVNFTIEQLDNPFAQPFVSANLVAAMDEITLGVERLHWMANPPGVGSCAAASSVQEWNYQLLEDWTLRTSQPTNQVWDLLQSTTGRVFWADGDGAVKYNDADGIGLWSTSFTSAGDANVLLQTGTGALLQGRGGVAVGIYRSTSDGDFASWSNVYAGAEVDSLFQLTSGRILAGIVNNILRSDDDGVTWAILATINRGGIDDILQIPNGDIFALAVGAVLRSDDEGATWTTISAPIAGGQEIIRLADGTLLIASNSSGVWISRNDGIDWSQSSLTSAAYSLLQLTDWEIAGCSPILVGLNGSIEMSLEGTNWQTLTSVMPGIIYSLLELSTVARLLAGEDSDIYSSEIAVLDMGADDTTCSNILYVSNKQNLANLTHIKEEDNAVFTDIFPATLPQRLLPAVPAVNDAVYFGIQSTIFNSGPFDSLVVDLSTAASSSSAYTILWEYSDGVAGWPALSVRDNTDIGNGPFGINGVGSIHWEQPSDFAAEAVDGVTAFWVRVRVTALISAITPPVQQNRDIYSIVLPFAEMANTAILGDVPALARIKVQNQSDEDGRGGSAPDLWDNRIVVGLRSKTRSENDGGNFQAYINISDEQNPVGIVISAGTNTTIGADVQTPTGRRATYNPVGVEAMATRATITLGPGIARDFYGEYHAFLRARRTGGAATDFDVQLQVSTGSGGIQETTESKQLQTTTAFEVLDFGQIEIPVFGTLKSSDLGDQTEIRIQASAANAAIDLYLYDIVLIPIDEWAGDFVDFHNQAESIIGRDNDISRLLDLDSVTNPKSNPQALVRQVGSEFISSAYDPITNGSMILQANANQRLWFFAMQTDAVGASPNWIAPFEIAHSIQITHNARYLGPRGDR